jgi:5-formaminoimidazole-4-carboxamide-1-(beta)-D-ribofuranosyl 5'-monophosphate synthetase
MISHNRIIETVKGYDPKNITIGVLGGHSALDVCHGAKKYGFKTVAVCQKGREKTYDKYYRSKPDMDVVPGQLPPWHATKGCVDEVILLDKFADIVNEDVQKQLRDMNTIFIHNRYFWVYCDFEKIENDFLVPIFGSREMLKLEERDVANNQYYLLEQAGVRFPKIFSVPDDIDRLALVKVNEESRGYERAFFLASSGDDFRKKSQELIDSKMISKVNLDKAVIEEFIVGAQVNFNYFYSPIDEELELMGTDMRRQTNLDGLLRLPAPEQMAVLKYLKPRMIETGHVAVTIKESLIEKAFDIGEKFIELTKRELPPGLVGPFALQGAVTAEDGREELVIFDVSLRIPGSPGTRYTPYSGYLYGDSMSYGERIAMEIQTAIKANKLDLIVT